MPDLTRLKGRWPVTSLPRDRMRPAEGRSEPAIMLNSVVLPAPLGPMKP